MSTPNRLSEPRSYLGTAIMFGVFFAAFTGLFGTWLNAAIEQRSFGEVLPRSMLTAAVSGLIFGAFMGALMRGETRVVNVRDAKSFVSHINIAAAQLGFRPTFATESHYDFRPTWQAGLLAGHLSVQLREHDAVIVGPRIYVKRLLIRLEAVS